MAFDIISLAKSAFKRSLGKAHTSNAKDLANEALPSGFQVISQNVFGIRVPFNDPAQAVADQIALDCTAPANRFTLVADLSSGGKAYLATVPSGHPITAYINPATGVNYAAGDRVQRIIAQCLGDDFRPILYNGTTEIPPLASQDWFLDCFAGIVTSEDDLSLGSNGKLGCYVYIEKMLDEVLDELETSSGGGSGSEWVTLQYAYNNGQTIDLDGYSNLSIHSEVDPYGLSVNVKGAVSLQGALDSTFSSDGYVDISSDKTIRFTDENTTIRLTDLEDTYGGVSGEVLQTTRRSLVGAINELRGDLVSYSTSSMERAFYFIESPITKETGLLVEDYSFGSIELESPEGPNFTFSRDVFVYYNGLLMLPDTIPYENNGNKVTRDISLSADGTKIYFYCDLVPGDSIQILNLNNEY